jgi:NAD(P)-dependent dehydrogenase (short-subunit alcohol dehydrogenase family)
LGNLNGQVAIVTGSTGGIGKAVAELFAAQGARVVTNGRRAAEAESVARAIRDGGGEAISAPGDISKPEDVEGIAEAAVAEWDTVNILVNNAAIVGPASPVGEEDIKAFLNTLTINVYGTFLMTRAVAPIMKKAGGGKIIDVSSTAARGVAGDVIAYRTSKGGVQRLSSAMAEHLRPNGIEVNSVDVLASTPMVIAMSQLDDQDPVLAERMRTRIVGKEPTVEENASVFLWLASDASDGFSGRNLDWSMNIEDLNREKGRIIKDERALREELVAWPTVGLSPAAVAYEERKETLG